MNSDFWLKKWQDDDIRFHQSNYHPSLVTFGYKFSEGSTILVPLCGKSLDMIFLAQNHQVIGVELSPIACRDFFKENKLDFQERVETDFIVFQSEKVTLWCGDFFKLPQEVWAQVSGIYDRAALIALPEEVRGEYCEEVSRHLKTDGVILLISIDYGEGSMKGPPFSVDEKEIRRTLKKFEIKKLSISSSEVRDQVVNETVYWLQKSTLK